jgi:hypothetical protein
MCITNLMYISRHVLFLHRVLCVKRKAGHLSYWDDPRGLSSLLARPRPKFAQVEGVQTTNNNNTTPLSDDGEADVSVDLLRSFTHDPMVISFANHFCSKIAVDPMFCGPGGERLQLALGTEFSRRTVSATEAACNDPNVVRRENAPFAKFCTTMLYHCLVNETPNMLTALVDMFQAVQAVPHTQHSLYLENLKLLEEFYIGPVSQVLGDRCETAETGSLDVNTTTSGLVAKDFVTSLSSTVCAFFTKISSQEAENDVINQYLNTLQVPPRSNVSTSGRLLNAMLCYYDIPSANLIMRCKNGQRDKVLGPNMLVSSFGKQTKENEDGCVLFELGTNAEGADVGVSTRGLVTMMRALRKTSAK